ncbi:MAG TPA: hypothetical protein VG028_22300 [Terriglobia bacterium]|nr:hypothetical protein [Terriglobia bacterium]
MKGDSSMAGKLAKRIIFLILVGALGTLAHATDAPLSLADVRLLLIGGAAPAKVVGLIEQRGISFKVTSDLEKKLRDDGADDTVIQALRKAQDRPAPAPVEQPETPAPHVATQPSPAPSAATTATSPDKKIADTLNDLTHNTPGGPGPVISPAAKPKAAKVDLSDPSPARIQNIIQEFAAKEKTFKEARNNYTYHQSNKVEELGPDNEVTGQYEQEWDILYDDNGQRVERVTYAPEDTLKKLILTKEDLYNFRNINPFVLTSDELPEYEIKYLGHVKVDYITAYVFSVRPKEIKKGREYFQGVIWVDDRDLQIVKSEGKPVPEPKTKGGENLFPRFTTYREQIDGKYWFPTFTSAEDTLYFSTGAVHMKEIIRYSEYKQFKSKTRIISATPTDQPNAKPIPVQPPKEKQ